MVPSRTRFRRLLAGLALALTPGCDGGARGNGPAVDTVRVAVAANFALAHDSLAARFHDQTGIAVVSVIGATGQLYAQIVNGAPVDLFLAADRERPQLLERDSVAVPGSRFTYASGRLAILAPRARLPVTGPEGLLDPYVTSIAIAEPTIAPYGRAAVEVMERWGVAERLRPRLVRGESIAQAYQFVASGAADVGFVSLSQLGGASRATYWIVPDSLHSPIAQDAVLLRGAAGRAAPARYAEFLRGDEARRVIESFGYLAPRPDDGR